MTFSEQIDAIVESAIERRVFPGAVVLIGAGERLRHHRAYGTTMYQAAESQPVQLETLYDVASLTKMFTASAALRLYDAGVLDLHAEVARYLPRFQAHEVTIWHLLTHTSGLDIRLSALRHASRAALMDSVYGLLPLRAPGTSVAYTNVNSLLLGEVVASVHGVALAPALDDLVIGALELRDTCFCPPQALKLRIAPTEMDAAWRGALVHGSVHDESAHALGGIAGHAGLFSSALDMYRFCLAWLRAASSLPEAEWFLRSTTARIAMTNHTAGLQAGCGLGWMIDRPNFMGPAPSGLVGHTGFTGPAIVIDQREGLIVVVLSNRVYPQRGAPAHHAVTAALVAAARESLMYN